MRCIGKRAVGALALACLLSAAGPATGLESTDLERLAGRISPDAAAALVTRLHEQYPTLHTELEAEVRAKHPTLEQDVAETVRSRFPDVYAQVDRDLRAAETPGERIAVLRAAVEEYPDARAAVLRYVTEKHTAVYGTVLTFVARDYPGVLVELAAAWLQMAAAEPDAGVEGE